MSDTRRIIEIYLDTESGLYVNENGKSADVAFDIYRKTETVIRAHLVRKDPTVYLAPPAGTTWFFAWDNSYNPDDADPVFTLDANFNIAADWTEIDAEAGKISWRIDTTSSALTTKLGVAASLAGKAELWMTPPGVSSVLLCQWDSKVINIVSEIGNDTELEYVSNNIIKFDGDDTVIYYPNGAEAYRYSRT